MRMAQVGWKAGFGPRRTIRPKRALVAVPAEHLEGQGSAVALVSRN
jgi:hypothetical protein